MPVTIPRDWRGLRNRIREAPEEVSDYFSAISDNLLEEYVWEVSLAYAFLRLEQAHNYCLYAGARKIHRADAKLASHYVDRQHITRKGFQVLFKNVFDKPLPQDLIDLIVVAEKVRDKVIHGKSANAVDQKKALTYILEYSIGLHTFILAEAGFSPFSNDRRGLTGRGETLDKSTTKWLMKGLGFGNKEDATENE